MAEKKRKGYFYEKEEEALKNYITATDQATKNRIYNTILADAFEKMISSIMRRYKLQVPDEEYEQTYVDTLSYLISKVNNFKPESGYKAYSYCGTVVRNYLLYKKTQYSKNLKRNVRFEDAEDEASAESIFNPDDSTFSDSVEIIIPEFIQNIKKMIEAPILNDLNKDEIKVGMAICDLFENWENIIPVEGSDKLRKRTILYFLREETKMSTKEVRNNMRKFKELYLLLKEINMKDN